MRELREAVSAAMVFMVSRVWVDLTMSWMERTWLREAMAQLGTMARSGVRAAMGMRPRSARLLRSSAAHCEGWV